MGWALRAFEPHRTIRSVISISLYEEVPPPAPSTAARPATDGACQVRLQLSTLLVPRTVRANFCATKFISFVAFEHGLQLPVDPDHRRRQTLISSTHLTSLRGGGEYQPAFRSLASIRAGYGPNRRQTRFRRFGGRMPSERVRVYWRAGACVGPKTRGSQRSWLRSRDGVQPVCIGIRVRSGAAPLVPVV